MLDPRWDSAFASCAGLRVTSHLPATAPAALSTLALKHTILEPLKTNLVQLGGTVVERTSSAGVRPPASVVWSFARAPPDDGRPRAADPADDTVFALAHATDVGLHLASGADGLAIRRDVLRAAAIAEDGAKVLLFVLDVSAAASKQGGQAWEANLRRAMQTAELRGRSPFFVNYRASPCAPFFPPVLALSSKR